MPPPAVLTWVHNDLVGARPDRRGDVSGMSGEKPVAEKASNKPLLPAARHGKRPQ